MTETANEIDYIENHRKLMEIGTAEKIVLESEIEFLKAEYPELAEKVRLVSNNQNLDLMFYPFESDERQKQIESQSYFR